MTNREPKSKDFSPAKISAEVALDDLRRDRVASLQQRREALTGSERRELAALADPCELPLRASR